MSRRVIIVSAIAIISGISLLGAWAISAPDALSYYVTASDLLQDPSKSDDRLRLGGRVTEISKQDGLVTFTVTDEIATVDVRYEGEVPDTLKRGTDVVAEGHLNQSGVLVADRVLAKCSSKFVPEEESQARLRAKA